MEREAGCACGRLNVRVSGDPHAVVSCHCEFCLKRTGGVYPVVAWFDRDQVLDVSGESTVFNGLEIDGTGNDLDFATIYYFCPVCGSTVYWTFDSFPDTVREGLAQMLGRTVAIGVGSFADPDFPPPQRQLRPELHSTWLTLHPEGG